MARNTERVWDANFGSIKLQDVENQWEHHVSPHLGITTVELSPEGAGQYHNLLSFFYSDRCSNQHFTV